MKRKSLIDLRLQVMLMVVPLLLSWQVYAQHDVEKPKGIKPKWKLAKVGLRFSTLHQDFSGMGYQGLQSMLKDPSGIDLKMEDYQKSNHFNTVMYGEKLGLFVNFNKPITPSVSSNWELGANIYTYGEVVLDYERKEPLTTSPSGDFENYLGWCLMQNRLDIEVAHLFGYTKNRFEAYAGPSISTAATFNDELFILRSSDTFDAEQSGKTLSSRYVFGHLRAGLYYTLFKHVNVSLEGRYGMGRQFISNETHNNISRSSGVSFGLAYRFQHNP